MLQSLRRKRGRSCRRRAAALHPQLLERAIQVRRLSSRALSCLAPALVSFFLFFFCPQDHQPIRDAPLSHAKFFLSPLRRPSPRPITPSETTSRRGRRRGGSTLSTKMRLLCACSASGELRLRGWSCGSCWRNTGLVSLPSETCRGERWGRRASLFLQRLHLLCELISQPTVSWMIAEQFTLICISGNRAPPPCPQNASAARPFPCFDVHVFGLAP